MAKGTVTFFANSSELPSQASGKGFGPVSATQFRCTSSFSGSAVASHPNPNAYAITSGKVALVETSNNRINLILKPDQKFQGIPGVKYFIYRGLLKSDFVEADGSISTTSSSDLIDEVKKNGGGGQAAVSTYSNLNDSFLLDDLFIKNTHAFHQVKQGLDLGRFDGINGFDYGLEILLEMPWFQANLGLARQETNIIDLTGLSAEQQAVKRLEVLAYIDPAAYFGSFYQMKSKSARGQMSVSSFFHNGGNPESEEFWTKSNIYKRLIDKFQTKNTVYLDLRDIDHLPYDLIDNTRKVRYTKNKTSNAANSSDQTISSNSWPIHIINGGFSNATQKRVSGHRYYYHTLRISLPKNGINLPLLHLQNGQWGAHFPLLSTFHTATKPGFNGTATNQTEDRQIAIPAAEDGGSFFTVASYVRLTHTSLDNDAEIDDQIPNQRFDQVAAESFSNSLSPTAWPVSNLTNVTIPNVQLSVQSGNPERYSKYRTKGYISQPGTAKDQFGFVSFQFRSRAGIHLESNNATANKAIRKAYNTSIVNLKEHLGPQASFYDHFSSLSNYPNNPINRSVYTPHVIQLSNDVRTLELAKADYAHSFRGLDLSPAEPLASVAMTTTEYDSFVAISNNSNNFSTPFFQYFKSSSSQTNSTVARRRFFSKQLSVRGLKFNTTTNQFEWNESSNPVVFRSLDGINFFTNDYATAYANHHNAFIWENQPAPPLNGSLYANASKFAGTTVTDLAAALGTLNSTDSLLLEEDLRAYLYRGDFDLLTREIAFGAPFFIRNALATPYDDITEGGTTVNNNPYINQFTTLFGTANTLRGLQTNPQLDQINHAGLTTTTAALAEDDNQLYQVLDVNRVAGFANNNVPAYMARVMEYENPMKRYDPKPHLPIPRRKRVVQKGPGYVSDNPTNAGDLDELVNLNIITAARRTSLRAIAAGNFGFEPITNGTYTINGTSRNLNGEFIIKDSSDNEFYSYTLAWNDNGNASGVTIGMGFDVGRRTYSQFEQYTGFQGPNALTGMTLNVAQQAMGRRKIRAMRIFYAFLDDIWDNIDFPWEDAVKATVPLMKNEYLGPGLNVMIRNHVSNNSLNFLKVFTQNGNVAFYSTGGQQFMNAVEKMFFLNVCYNSGAGNVSVNYTNSRNAGDQARRRSRARRMIHSINTHDLRYLRYALPLAGMYGDPGKRLRLISRPIVASHYKS